MAPRVYVLWDGGSHAAPLSEAADVTIGRAPECEIVVPHTSVSRRHVTVRVAHGRITVEDLASSNGTRLGGRRLAAGERAVLNAGDVVEFGVAQLMVHGGSVESQPVGTPLGISTAMAAAIEAADVVATGDIPVLFLGETGVGKDVLATRVHERSSRRARPLLRINCAALPDALLEGELFGYERGAFTGAVQAKPGLLEAAEGGTVLLDEIGDASPAIQSKLLRAIENHEIFRLGSVKPRSIDVRFLAATSRDLDTLVSQGQFRPDLLYRIRGAVVRVPALRERVEEIAPLALAFLEDASRRAGRTTLRLSAAAREVLEGQRWPGNVRELKSTMERAALFCRGDVVGPEHLGLADSPTVSAPSAPGAGATIPPPAPTSASLSDEVSALERQRILEALEECAGNQSRAAKMLGISRRTLLHRLDDYGVPRPRKGTET
jgi:transcriptional regulator with GAF, ATPase, and Fis domain